MRISSILLSAFALLCGAALAGLTAYFSAIVVEDNSKSAVQIALAEQGLTWGNVDVDGLQVFVHGTAPTEVDRFKALTVAATVVDSARVIDQIDIEDLSPVKVPEFKITLLKNGGGVSAIGLLPASTRKEALLEELQVVAAERAVSDLLDLASYPAPTHWNAHLVFGVETLSLLDQAQISVSSTNVDIAGLVSDPAKRGSIETKIRASLPETATLTLNLMSPRPVISPYAFRAVKTDTGVRVDACSVPSEKIKEEIEATLKADLGAEPTCRIGLGMPTSEWPNAVSAAAKALGAVEQGDVTLSDTRLRLFVTQSTSEDAFNKTRAKLLNDLPAGYELQAVLEAPETETDVSTLETTITISPEGSVQIRGPLRDELSELTVKSMAEARFGADKVRVASRLDPSIPRNWGASVLAVVEASAQLSQGVAILDNESISIKGQSNIASVNSDIAGLLSEKLGTSHQYQINVTYIEPPIAPEDIVLAQDICVDRIGDILSTQKINFEPGSDRVDLAGKKILDDIAEILKSCGQIELEIAGHTDSQGREEMNRQLSQSRAQAVLFELQNRRVLTTNMVAKGYGESEPIADNASEEGREANRRIEFKLVENTGPEPSDQTQEANTDGQN